MFFHWNRINFTDPEFKSSAEGHTNILQLALISHYKRMICVFKFSESGQMVAFLMFFFFLMQMSLKYFANKVGVFVFIVFNDNSMLAEILKTR